MNRRNFLKNLGLASVGIAVAGSVSSLVIPSIKEAAKPIMAVKINGSYHWYDLEMEKAMSQFMATQEANIWGMSAPPDPPSSHSLFLDFSS